MFKIVFATFSSDISFRNIVDLKQIIISTKFQTYRIRTDNINICFK